MKKTKTPSTFFRLLKYLLKSFPLQYVLIISTLLVSSAASIANTVFSSILINTIISPFQDGSILKDEAFQRLMILGVSMAAFYILGVACNLIYQRTIAITSQKFSMKVRIDMFTHMEDLPIKYFDTHKHGTIMSTYTNDTDNMWQLSSQSLPQLLSNSLTIIVLFCLMMVYSIYLGLVVILFAIIMILISKKCAGISSKAFLKQQRNLAALEGYIEEMISGQKVIKVFNHEEEVIEGFDKVNQTFFKEGERGNKFTNILMPILMNMGHIMYICVALSGALFISFEVPNLTIVGIGAPLSIGVAVSFLIIARQFTAGISHFSQQINSVVLGTASARRIFELLDTEPEIDDGYVTLVNCVIEDDGSITECEHRTGHWAWKHPHSDGTLTYTLLKGDIVLDDVDFGYTEDKLVLKNISVYAHEGQKIAFVGSTGAGKTTITNLINRFYDIADGKIRYDGININKIKKDDLRRSLGVVLQEVNLFSGTIMDNIRYGKLDATDEECIEAAKLANAHDFITRLPNGYDTYLKGDGSNLSQGQRQLISIARAAVANPPVLILDEATSSIDTRTEVHVQAGMDALMHGRTVFVIAHRLSTIMNSDCIMVLEHGEIIERGTHDELIERKGTYYQLYTGNLELD